MQTLIQDLRYGARMLLTKPGFTFVAVLTLALGIGANTAIFSVVNAVLLRPLTYKNPERLVSLWENVPGHGRWRASPANFHDWKKQSTLFEDISAYGGSTMSLTGDGEPEQLHGSRVSSGYFAVVGVYAVSAFAVTTRTREIGIRAALGASRFDVIRLVLRNGASPVLGGLAVGAAIAVILGPALSGMLFGVTPRDVMSLAISLAALASAALLASIVPARRAARIDPIVALRVE